MSLIEAFDPSVYMTTPRLDVPSLMALGRQLLAAAPADLPRQAVGCKRTLREAVQRLASGYQAAQTAGASTPKRPVDHGADNSWACVRSRLEAYTWLDESRFPVAARARVLSQKLFPSGLAFTQLEYGAQWAEASWRMALIAEEELEPELRRLCGDLFIDELIYWHREYEKMVGVVPRREAVAREPRPDLAELRRQTAQAVVAWQAQLVALHLSGHPGARAALRPTDEYREKLAAAAPASLVKDPPAPSPAAPVPPVPAPAP